VFGASYYRTCVLSRDPGFIFGLPVTQEEDVDLITVYTDIYNMRIELEKMKKPIGTRDSPARSCKDLFHGHPQLKDGELTLMSPDKIRELLLRKDVYAVLQNRT
jgi:hypothetical protein